MPPNGVQNKAEAPGSGMHKWGDGLGVQGGLSTVSGPKTLRGPSCCSCSHRPCSPAYLIIELKGNSPRGKRVLSQRLGSMSPLSDGGWHCAQRKGTEGRKGREAWDRARQGRWHSGTNVRGGARGPCPPQAQPRPLLQQPEGLPTHRLPFLQGGSQEPMRRTQDSAGHADPCTFPACPCDALASPAHTCLPECSGWK